jgi:ATP-binding cassette subfamily C protein LapB
MQTKDQLLECLVVFTKIYNRPYDANSLVSGLPKTPGRATPQLFSLDKLNSKSLFSRAAKRAGFSSKLASYQLSDISSLLLPVILILKNEKACILTQIKAGYAKVILPELPDGENWIKLEDLEEEYTGYSFLLKPEHHYKDAGKKVLKHETKHWFWDTLKFSKTIYIDVIIASFLINLFVLASPLFTMNVYDRVVPNSAIDTMWVLAIGVIVIYFLDLGLKFLRSFFLEHAAKKSDIIMSSLIFEKVLNMKMEDKPRSVGSFANNLKDFESIRSFLTGASVATIVDLPFTAIFLLVIYILAGWMVLIPFSIALIIIIYSFIVEKPLRKSIQSTYEAAAYKNSILIESLTALETIKSLGINGHMQWKWEESTGDIAKKGLKSRILNTSIASFVNFFIQINTVAIVIAGVYAIDNQTLSMGGLIACVILGSRILSPLGQFASLIASFDHTKTAYDAINDVMKLKNDREDEKKYVQREAFKGKIEFKNVTFAYPNSEYNVLNDVSFTIQPNECVGIIGKNGSGKTTIEKLILGLYKPTSGAILIDGTDINQIDPATLRSNISYVPQDVLLFQGTIKENILLKHPNATDEELLFASKLSGVDEFVNTHPMGFDMVVGERGDELSGGQKQSIGIARAFIQKSPIVLLDEPSSSMDSNKEIKFTTFLNQHKQNHTTILISHKNTLLDITNRLILLDKGKVLIDGKREDVLEKLNAK